MREAKTLKKVANGGMLHLQPGGIGQGITQIEQRDVRVLINQFAEKRLMRYELSRTLRVALWRRIDPTGLASPVRVGGLQSGAPVRPA